MNIITVTSGHITSYTPGNHYNNDIDRERNERFIIGVTDKELEILQNSTNGIDGRMRHLCKKGGTFAVRMYISTYYKTPKETQLIVYAPENLKVTSTQPWTGFHLWIGQYRKATFEEEYIYNNELAKYQSN